MFVDTSFCIDLMREHSRGMTDGPALSKLRELGNIPLYMSIFVACELHAGARLSARPSLEIRKVERLTDRVEMVSPDKTFPVAYGEAEAALRKRGMPIPVMDLLIGTMAKMHGMPLVARREMHFRLIPGLVVDEY